MVMPMDPTRKYSGQDGAVYFDGVLSEIVEKIDYNGDRPPIEIQCVGDSAPRQFDGQYKPTLNLTINQSDWDFFVALMTDTPLEGTATVLHAGIGDPTTTPETTAMSTTACGTPSRIKLTAKTAAVTTAGKLIVFGTNAADAPISEVLTVPVMEIDASAPSSVQFFKTVSHVVAFDYVQVGGTMEVKSIAGDLTASITPKSKRMTIIIQATRDDGVRGILTITNCWPTKHAFTLSTPTEHMNPTIPFAITNPNTDVQFERVVV